MTDVPSRDDLHRWLAADRREYENGVLVGYALGYGEGFAAGYRAHAEEERAYWRELAATLTRMSDARRARQHTDKGKRHDP